MKRLVIEKTKYLLANSWLGTLLHSPAEKMVDKPVRSIRQHPAESRISRHPGSKVRP